MVSGERTRNRLRSGCLSVVARCLPSGRCVDRRCTPGLVTYGVSWEFNGPLFEPLHRLLALLKVDEHLKGLLEWVKHTVGVYEPLDRLYPYIYPQFLAKLGLAAGIVLLIGRSLRERDDVVSASGRLLRRVLLFSATLYPWYLTWALPWAALEWRRAWLLLAATIQLAYLPQLFGIEYFPWVYLSIWVPFALVAGWERWKRPETRRLRARPGRTGRPLTARLIVAYEGTDLAGWQRQPNTTETVQQKLEEALEKLFGDARRGDGFGADRCRCARSRTERASLGDVGQPSGRGASLSGPRCEFIPSTVHTRPAGGPDARGISCAQARPRRSSTATAGRRAVSSSRRGLAYLAPAPATLDVGGMRRAAEVLQGRFDFASFARSGGAHQQSVRTVQSADLHQIEDELHLEVRGEGFLRGMVRAIAGTLLEVGTGRRSVEDVERLLGTEERPARGPKCGRTQCGCMRSDARRGRLCRGTLAARRRGLPVGLGRTGAGSASVSL